MTYEKALAGLNSIRRTSTIMAGMVIGGVRYSAGIVEDIRVAAEEKREALEVCDKKDELLGVVSKAFVIDILAIIDAYFKSSCLKHYRPLEGDEAWYTPEAVDMILGIRVEGLLHWSTVKMLYDARDIILRDEWNIWFSLERMDAVLRTIETFLFEFKEALEAK